MRIALVLDPPAWPVKAASWLRDLARQPDASILMLPPDDACVTALDEALSFVGDGDDQVIVLARAAIGSVTASEWRELGLSERAGELEPARAPERTFASAHERAEHFSALADEALSAAADALSQALAARPRDPRLLERLQAVMEASARWREAVDAKVALSETIEDPRDRARALAAAAGMCARRTDDVMRSVALYEAAIADDPTTPRAFEAIEAVLVKNDDFAGVERAYVRQLERLAGRKQTGAEAALLDKLSDLRAQRLGDLPGAIAALDRLVVTQPSNVEARVRLAKLLEQSGQLELAVRCLQDAARVAPGRAGTFRDLHRLCHRLGDVDRDYCACSVLVHLGEAEPDEQLVYQRFAPETTPRPRATLDESGWQALSIDEHDHVVSRIVRAVAPAAIELRLEQLRGAGRLPVLDRRERQHPDKSTLTAVRAAAWAAAALGLREPAIYAKNQEILGGLVSIALPEPTLLFGKALLSGRAVPELVFAIARELASQELGARLFTFYPTSPELRALVLAAVSQVIPVSLSRDAIGLREALAQKLDTAARAELESATRALSERDGRLDLTAWIHAVEIASCRAGLLACGDITAAARMLAIDGRVVGKLSAAERVRDLIPFSVSEQYGKLREAIGVEAGRTQTAPHGTPV